jgi:hypothetical protein
MPNDESWFEEEGDEFCDNEYPDEDESDDDRTATVVCPACGAEIYEDAEYCPVCDNYVTPGDNAFFRRPLWWILLGLAGIVATLLALAGFLSW